MNILYCGDSNIEKGLIISVLSLLKHCQEELHIYVLTMTIDGHSPVRKKTIEVLSKRVKNVNANSFVKLIDITDVYQKCLPTANMETRFTPYCMLRLFADELSLPSKILYLDNDVVCYNNFQEFYDIDNSNYELVGVLDYYGSHFFKKNIFKKDYLNSGVLLLNLDLIKKTGLFKKAREMCQTKKMLLPDQSALNKLANSKLIVNSKYNSQHQLKSDTVFRHFSTTFKIFPVIKPQTIKPWDVEKMHQILKIYEFDDIIEEYQKIWKGNNL